MGKRARDVQASELQGFKYFKILNELLVRLEDIGAERDKAGNRDLFCDQYLARMNNTAVSNCICISACLKRPRAGPR